jgi:hypothetical protein
MTLNAVTFYSVDRTSTQAVAVFRLRRGEIEVEDLASGDRIRPGVPPSASTTWLGEWLEGTWDPEEERMITPQEGERYLHALIDRPMTRWRFEPGEPDPTFGWHPAR